MENQAPPSANTPHGTGRTYAINGGGTPGPGDGIVVPVTGLGPSAHEVKMERAAEKVDEIHARQTRLMESEADGIASPYTWRSASITKLTAALSKAQAAFTEVKKSKTAGKDGGFTYKYADLADVISATSPALSANELVLTQPITFDDGKQWLRTLLLHVSGEWIEARMELPIMRDPKAFGSALTYARRYAEQALLNVAAEEDLDGATPPPQGDRGGSQGKGPSSGPKPNREHPKGPAPKDGAQPAGFAGHAVVPMGFGEKAGKKLEELSDADLEAYVALYAKGEGLTKPAKAFKAIFDRYHAHRKKAAAPAGHVADAGPEEELQRVINVALKAGTWAVEGLKKASKHLYQTDESEKLTVDQIVDFTSWVKNGTYVQFAEHHNLK